MRAFLCCLALGGLVCLAPAQRGPGGHRGPGDQHGPPGPRGPIHPLLKKVMESRDKVKFSGVREITHMEGGERKLTTEKVFRDGSKVRTIVTDSGRGQGVEAVEDNRRRLVWNPKLNEIREFAPREAEFFLRFGRMGGRFKPNEDLQESDGGNVAGVPTRQLQFGSAGKKPVSRVWIDPVHGLVLKFQSFDKSGNVVGSMEYTSIQFNPNFGTGTFELNKPGAKFVSIDDDLVRAAKELGMKPYRLSNGGGWKLVGVRKLTPKGVKVLMQTYFGPEARVSLFQIQGDVDAERLRQMEGSSTRSYVWIKDGARLVLIGNRPEDELRRLATRVTG